ncbi:hypothetical protein HOP60_18905 [Halomonas daqingensis]|uniref:Galectin n=1 Tax=Billgrantia desiderata TaxID=52021 RepID=A0ABS9B979_9GAMM|nr:hypothetical protein [Halomonas desiderata]MCE8044223.1 hypothetical protein [Halomonas desiderata]MCE8048797.1 hypothetical protein [Halomonas desiderata]
MFSWDQTAFVEILGVIPVVTDEFGTDYSFKVTRPSVTLTIGINEDVGDCSVLLHCSSNDSPIFRAVYLHSPGARVVRDKRGYFIEIGAPGSFSGSYDSLQPLHHGLRIWVEPDVFVETFGGA